MIKILKFELQSIDNPTLRGNIKEASIEIQITSKPWYPHSSEVTNITRPLIFNNNST